VYMLP